MKCSICIAAHNKPVHLDRALQSIFRQSPPFPFEVIVAVDGDHRDVHLVCKLHPVMVLHVPSPGYYRNPAVARNAAYRKARGEVMILQSDDVQHVRFDTIERLVGELMVDSMVFANVVNVLPGGETTDTYTGPRRRRPFFFLGSVHREHVFAVGGNSEDFTEPGFDDTWLGDCLLYGRGLRPVFSETIIGHHLDHHRPPLRKHYRRMNDVYQRKRSEAKADPSKWVGGPAWSMSCP